MSAHDSLPPLPAPAVQASEGVCCGNFTSGAEYMGQREWICCGQPDEAHPDLFTPDQMHTYALAAVEAALLERFDQAIAAELPRVSHVHYDSHEICKHFAGEVRKRIDPIRSRTKEST
jgi:hypothetical protein